MGSYIDPRLERSPGEGAVSIIVGIWGTAGGGEVAFSAVVIRVRLRVCFGVVLSTAAFLIEEDTLRVLRAIGVVTSSSCGVGFRLIRVDIRGVGPGEGDGSLSISCSETSER